MLNESLRQDLEDILEQSPMRQYMYQGKPYMSNIEDQRKRERISRRLRQMSLTQPQKNVLARQSRELGASRKRTMAAYGSAGEPYSR